MVKMNKCSLDFHDSIHYWSLLIANVEMTHVNIEFPWGH